jgi:DNA-binding SARP family transcriptional activator
VLHDVVTTNGRQIELQLFGWWNLQSGGVSVTLGHREQRLIALLALRGSRPRSHVAGTLWPDTTDARALTSLRAAVLQIRRHVADLLDVGRTTIGLRPGVHVDVADLHRCVDEVTTGPDVDAAGAMNLLQHADLLPGWYEDWVLFERERLQHLRLRALEELAVTELSRGDTALAVEAAGAAIAIEPLHETAHELVIRGHLQAGNRAAAVRAYHLFRRRLAKELGIPPSPTLAALVEPLVSAARQSPGLELGVRR